MKPTTLSLSVTIFTVSLIVLADNVQLPVVALAAPNGPQTNNSVKPNFIFIMSDDQDYEMDSLDYMPLLKKYIADEGTRFERHYATTAQCCPSRTSLWTGKTTHNTNVTDVRPPYGAWVKFVERGFNEDYFPIWLTNNGYNTYYTGKFQNGQRRSNYGKDAAHFLMKGWTSADVLLEPYTYNYNQPGMKRDKADFKLYNNYTTDLISAKGIDYIKDAHKAGKPFFVGIAPIAPHVQTWGGNATPTPPEHLPISAPRHSHMFPTITVPPTKNFNPNKTSGGGWVQKLPKLNTDELAQANLFYRRRLQALQAVDELVEAVIKTLDDLELFNNTYIIYTTDNGYHIGQHRIPPGKGCAYETDVHIPFMVRGPGVDKGVNRTDVVTNHVDVAPTLLTLAGIPLGPHEFDGTPMPIGKAGEAAHVAHEHVGIEFWGEPQFEGAAKELDKSKFRNNTYKALRIMGTGKNAFNLGYIVWCNGDHELYDMTSDPYQMDNLMPRCLAASCNTTITIGGKSYSVKKVRDRLDGLVQAVKKCENGACIKPWSTLHMNGNVTTLADAMNTEFDDYYDSLAKMKYDTCYPYYNAAAEGPVPKPFNSSDDLFARWTDYV
ncbi:Arylsulfatase [Mycena venus]|uniref:Arylsulfatase n=1 Tax=Mycena venus TaxID=2733690 RepID=A0A8H7CR50_9AGAR|nr:Arylsulfatase [Mycena venus]